MRSGSTELVPGTKYDQRDPPSPKATTGPLCGKQSSETRSRPMSYQGKPAGGTNGKDVFP